MLRLIRAYSKGEYRGVPDSTLVVIVAAIIYLINPLDVIPDALPALGFLDDATVLALSVRRSRQIWMTLWFGRGARWILKRRYNR